MPKYKNYAELSAAFKSGELDAKHYYISLDKGGYDARLCYSNDEMDDGKLDEKNDEAKEIFTPPYRRHIHDLYAALGIPVEDC